MASDRPFAGYSATLNPIRPSLVHCETLRNQHSGQWNYHSQDRVVMSVIKALQEMGLSVVSTTELGTGSIHIRGKRGDDVKIVAVVDVHGRAYYDTWN